MAADRASEPPTASAGWGARPGQAGAAAAHRQEVGPATDLEQALAHQRDPLADPDRGAMAGHAGPLWALADGVRAVSALAARRQLATDPHRACRPRPTLRG
jgi:hypothetical protein